MLSRFGNSESRSMRKVCEQTRRLDVPANSEQGPGVMLPSDHVRSAAKPTFAWANGRSSAATSRTRGASTSDHASGSANKA